VGTANFFDPDVTIKIIDGISRWCTANSINKIDEVFGCK